MKAYMQLCLIGESSIPQRKELLERTKEQLLQRLETIRESLDYIDRKQAFYNDVLDGKTPYYSNLTKA